MSKAHRLKPHKSKGLTLAMPINFLLGCSENSLANFELARLAEVAELRRELLAIQDRLFEQMVLAAQAAWFRTVDRHDLKVALENPDDIEAIIQRAREQIRDGQRSPEELLPLPSLPPGAAHLAAAKRYAERNLAEGKCRVCPKPQDPNSVELCTEHLAKARTRKTKGQPGTADYLYGQGFEDRRGRTPGNLARLEMELEKKTRAVLAELGIPPESAAVSLKAAKEALLRVMPDSKAKAMTAYDLFQAAQIPTGAGRRSTTGYKALRELLSAGKIRRIGKAKSGHPFRYFALKNGPRSPGHFSSVDSRLIQCEG